MNIFYKQLFTAGIDDKINQVFSTESANNYTEISLNRFRHRMTIDDYFNKCTVWTFLKLKTCFFFST